MSSFDINCRRSGDLRRFDSFCVPMSEKTTTDDDGRGEQTGETDPFADAEPERTLTTEPHWANLAKMGKIDYKDAIEHIHVSDNYTMEEAAEIWFDN